MWAQIGDGMRYAVCMLNHLFIPYRHIHVRYTQVGAWNISVLCLVVNTLTQLSLIEISFYLVIFKSYYWKSREDPIQLPFLLLLLLLVTYYSFAPFNTLPWLLKFSHHRADYILFAHSILASALCIWSLPIKNSPCVYSEYHARSSSNGESNLLTTIKNNSQ